MIEFFNTYAPMAGMVLGAALPLAVVIVKLTPTKRDDEALKKYRPWIEKVVSWLTRNKAQAEADKAG